MRGRYVILCNYKGGVLNDPVLLRISKMNFGLVYLTLILTYLQELMQIKDSILK